jgi:hypothetical protein
LFKSFELVRTTTFELVIHRNIEWRQTLVMLLTRKYGGLNRAAASLGFSSVQALQSAIMAFCGE